MKRIGQYYYKDISYTNLEHSYSNVKKTCKNKKKLNQFLINESLNIYDILEGLYYKNYSFNKYNIFLIKEPKYRIVMSEEINDKITSYFISEFLLRPYIEPTLIYSNVAIRKNKGSSLAYNLFEKYIKEIRISNKIYVLRIDISKYFYNIDHEILIKKLERKIKDKDVINLINKLTKRTNSKYINESINKLKENEIKKIRKRSISDLEKQKRIDEINKIPLYKKGKGLSIGNITSQLLAVFYLNDVDHYIKEELKYKHYIRYMDDLIIISADKNKLKRDFLKISKKINEDKLVVNPKSKIHVLNNGFTFLGYTYCIKNNKLIKRVKNVNRRKINKKLKYLKNNNYEKYFLSLISYKGYIKKIYNLNNEYNFLLTKYPNYDIYYYNKGIIKSNNNKIKAKTYAELLKTIKELKKYIVLKDNKVVMEHQNN